MREGQVRIWASTLLLLLLFTGPLPFAVSQQKDTQPVTTKQIAPAPYQKDEFPAWLLDLRRAEIVAFGSLPFMVFFTTFAVDSYRFYTHNWDRLYAPWPLKAPGAIEMDETQRIASFSVAVGLSVAAALVDYILVQNKRSRQKESAPPILQPDIRIEPWNPDQTGGQE
ncbi:MAG: hypothetical protein LDL24_00765 [Treponema sp.]|nr:hypothetical protein [Treponema sp.]